MQRVNSYTFAPSVRTVAIVGLSHQSTRPHLHHTQSETAGSLAAGASGTRPSATGSWPQASACRAYLDPTSLNLILPACSSAHTHNSAKRAPVSSTTVGALHVHAAQSRIAATAADSVLAVGVPQPCASCPSHMRRRNQSDPGGSPRAFGASAQGNFVHAHTLACSGMQHFQLGQLTCARDVRQLSRG